MLQSLFSSFDADPFGVARRLEDEVDQLFSGWGWPAGIRSVRRGTFPPINVGATPERVDVYLFAAGLDPKSIDVSIQQNVLTVSGVRLSPVDGQASYYRRERFDGDFRRVIALPDDVDSERTAANYRNGVLHITVPRREAVRPRQIAVN
jgi:HSP20 family protein